MGKLQRINVERALISMGMPVYFKGFKAITDAVLLLDSGWDGVKFMAVYDKVGKQNNADGSVAERRIRYALSKTREYGFPEKVSYYLGERKQNFASLSHLYWVLKNQEN